MINAKAKVISSEHTGRHELDLNRFLETIDFRQVVKIDHSSACGTMGYRYTTIVYYVEMEDIRDMKLELINIK